MLKFLLFPILVSACWKKYEINEYKCSYGNCIEDPNNQRNGNMLCIVNDPSFELALKDCKSYQCEHIAKYEFNGKGLLIFREINEYFYKIIILGKYFLQIFLRSYPKTTTILHVPNFKKKLNWSIQTHKWKHSRINRKKYNLKLTVMPVHMVDASRIL